jgi:hypothetical protein
MSKHAKVFGVTTVALLTLALTASTVTSAAPSESLDGLTGIEDTDASLTGHSVSGSQADAENVELVG